MNRRGSLTFGVLLILIGGWFLAVEFFPPLQNWIERFADWPFWIVAPGLVFLLAAVISGVSGLAVPGAIISGIGGILYYQNLTQDWESWSYAWTLIIGFVGIGVFLMHVLDGQFGKAVREGGNAIITSVVLFLVLGSIFRSIFGQSPLMGNYWPVLLIFLGGWMLVKPLLRRRSITD